MAAQITNYDLYRDASLDRLHPKFHTSTGIMHELYRHFGPSPMRAPLHLRISNRGIMQDSHLRILGQEADKVERRSRSGQLRHMKRQLNKLGFNLKY